MSNFLQYFLTQIAIMGLLFTMGCKREDPNPHLLDPIYADLLSMSETHKKQSDEAKAKIAELQASLEKAAPHSIDLKDIRRDLERFKLQKKKSDQLGQYYEIRAQRRAVEGKMAYKRAFASDQTWPPPNEYSEYSANKRLNAASPNWGARVPRLNDRYSKKKP